MTSYFLEPSLDVTSKNEVSSFDSRIWTGDIFL